MDFDDRTLYALADIGAPGVSPLAREDGTFTTGLLITDDQYEAVWFGSTEDASAWARSQGWAVLLAPE
jgi:hypothetical protein